MVWLFVHLFRLPWFVYFIIAPVIMALGGAAIYHGAQVEAAKAVARAAPPPAAVPVEKFDPARNIGTADEVILLGQLDLERSMDYIQTRNNREEHHWTGIPIYPATAVDASGPARAVLIQDGPLTDEQLAKMMVATGKFGPILKIDGMALTDPSAREAVDKMFAARGPDTKGALLIDPFENGRGDGLKPSDGERQLGIGMIIIGLFVAGYGVARFFWQKSERAPSGYI